MAAGGVEFMSVESFSPLAGTGPVARGHTMKPRRFVA